ncbi:MAG: hypothetical protein LBR85_06660 [Oscillospiraceae bacterium]|nr:hypothetical protein [Oscillospiraceae bacterium]
MDTKKKRIILWICLPVLALAILSGGVLLGHSIARNSQSETHFYIPFPRVKTAELDPEAIVAEMMQAIGYPNAVPMVTLENLGQFWTTVYAERDNPEYDMRLLRMAGEFLIRVSVEGQTRERHYEFRNFGVGEEEMLIIYKDRGPSIDMDYALTDILSAVRDFPADLYRETEVGRESVDVYNFEFGHLLANTAGFSYDSDGLAERHEDSIPFTLIHAWWHDGIPDYEPDSNVFHGSTGHRGEGRESLFYNSDK